MHADELRNSRHVLIRLVSRTGGSSATQLSGQEKMWVAPSVWPMAIWVCSVCLANTDILVWSMPTFRSVESGQYPYFRLFSLANNHISVCSVWPYLGLFSLANNHISVCSVWPIPIFRSVQSGQYPYFGLFSLAIFGSVQSGQYPYFGLFSLANNHFSVCSVWPIPIFRSVQSSQ